MEKYKVWTCGYCPEVQVGPNRHKVRICKASKHQPRDGMHAWQEAGVEDTVGPYYVWHVRDLNGPALDNNLKRFYGKAPAVVELCVHGGALVPYQYRSMMRLDVVPPNRDEADLPYFGKESLTLYLGEEMWSHQQIQRDQDRKEEEVQHLVLMSSN
ncbi:hypothetical protein ACFE04_018526 [Oxalis oulophora]